MNNMLVDPHCKQTSCKIEKYCHLMEMKMHFPSLVYTFFSPSIIFVCAFYISSMSAFVCVS
jgi:hypothetical protein